MHSISPAPGEDAEGVKTPCLQHHLEHVLFNPPDLHKCSPNPEPQRPALLVVMLCDTASGLSSDVCSAEACAV